MKTRLPSINALRSFEAAARHQSFTLAAAELSVTPAAIGFQVKRLEEDLGRPLFIRTHRAVQTTQEGATLLNRLSDGFGLIEAAWADAKTQPGEAPLKVTAPVAVVQRWLFHEPSLQTPSDQRRRIAWDISHQYRALDDTGVDAAIRNAIEPDPDLFCEPLLRQWFTPLMRPDVARSITSPSDLLRRGLINVDFRLDAETGSTAWSPWFKAQGLRAPETFEMVCADTITAVDMAVETGHIAIGGYFLADDHLKSGRLVAPFDIAICAKTQLWFMCQKGRENEARMVWFRNIIQASAARLKDTAARLTLFDLDGEKLPS